MREHLGVDVDGMYEEDLMASHPVQEPHDIEEWDPDQQQEYGKESGVTHVGKGERRTATKSMWHDTVDAMEQGESFAEYCSVAVSHITSDSRNRRRRSKGYLDAHAEAGLEDERP